MTDPTIGGKALGVPSTPSSTAAKAVGPVAAGRVSGGSVPAGPVPAGPARVGARVVVRPVAGMARPRRRHWLAMAGLAVVVVLPTLIAGLYLWLVAADQYASTVGFSVRKEEAGSAIEILGGITDLSSSSSSDTDILYEYIQSQELIRKIDEKLDLRGLYSRPTFDPVFAFDTDGQIEDLVAFWKRMVRINYDGGTGLIELQVRAFDPKEARAITEEIFLQSSVLINELTSIAREDATRYAREELERSIERLKVARATLTDFRSRTSIVDPTADIQGQMGLMNTLQQQLADALISYDLLISTGTPLNDPRVEQSNRRIVVIRKRVDDERGKLGADSVGPGGENYATLISEFERLTVDRQFGEQAYIAALAALDAAQADAQRKSRYLAAYIKPTLAEQSEYPQRLLLTALTALFSFMVWAIAMLVYYSIRDRR